MTPEFPDLCVIGTAMIDFHKRRGKRRRVYAFESRHDIRSAVRVVKKRTPAVGLCIWTHTVGLADGIPASLKINVGSIATHFRIRAFSIHVTHVECEGILLSTDNDLGFDDLVHDRSAADIFLREVTWPVLQVRAGESKSSGEEKTNCN